MAPRLIVNADDLGMAPGVNKGIFEAMTDGIVSSTTLMVNMPSAPAAVEVARQRGWAVGMHLNLTTGRPVSPPCGIPSLVRDDGSFHPFGEFIRRLVRLKISVGDMYRELSAQIETARRMGVEPTHLDTHHNIQLWLPVAWVLLQVGRRCGIRRTRTTRTTDMALGIGRSRTVGGWAKRRYKSATAVLLGTWFQLPTWRMEASAFRITEGSGARSVHDEWQRLIAGLEKLPVGQVVEVSCHPGYVDDELRGHARYVDGRQEEIAALTSGHVKAALARAGVDLVSFRDLPP